MEFLDEILLLAQVRYYSVKLLELLRKFRVSFELFKRKVTIMQELLSGETESCLSYHVSRGFKSKFYERTRGRVMKRVESPIILLNSLENTNIIIYRRSQSTYMEVCFAISRKIAVWLNITAPA